MKRPTVCLVYLSHPNDEPYLKLSVSVMEAYDWVTQIIVIGTHDKAMTHGGPKVTNLFHPFGEGFNRQPEAGGFDELAARNFALGHGRRSGCDWILLMDPDEIFTDSTINVISKAEQNAKRGIYFECHHAYSLTEMIWHERAVLQLFGNTLHDPHLRAVRKDLNSWFILHKSEALRKTWQNRTMHCYIESAGVSRQLVGYNGVYHIHLHYLLPPKRPHSRPDHLREFEAVWPQAVQDAFLATQSAHP